MAKHRPLRMFNWNYDAMLDNMRYTLFTIEMLAKAMTDHPRQYGHSADLYEQFCFIYNVA
jgi:hypothetical protein